MVQFQSRNILIGVTILIFVIAFGTSGYMFIEKWDFSDAIYMTVITLTTVGYGEVRPLSSSGRVFTICLLIMGVGFVFYMFGTITQIMVEGQFRKLLGRRKLGKQLAALKDHYIICGYGRIGQIISREIAKKPLPLVIIENRPDLIKTIEEQGHLFIEGDATQEDTLLKANIQKAKGLVATVSSDADNVYIILTARGLNPGLYIMARVVDEKAERNLLQAGATRVISPYHIGARKMAQVILRPAVTDFIEVAVHRGGMELQIEEIPVRAPSRVTEAPLKESGIRQELGLIIIGIQRASGEMLYNPPPDARIQVGDTLIAMGSPESLSKLEKMVGVAEG